MAGRADLGEEAVRLAELSLAPLLVAALVRELGELDVDQRLERLRTRLARQLERPCERRLDLCTRLGAAGGPPPRGRSLGGFPPRPRGGAGARGSFAATRPAPAPRGRG